MRADFEVLDAAGRARLRLSGWQVKRIDLPENLYAFRLAPRDVILSRPQAVRLPGSVAACRLELPRDFMDVESLRYRLNHGGSFLLYSVGDDARDDGADPFPTTTQSDDARYLWNGRDWVWPQLSATGQPGA